MNIFEKSRKTVAKGLTVRVSNHYKPTLFGIRGHYESSYKSGQYVECGSPGTGFFIRASSSHSYKNFCAAEKAKLKNTYLDYLRGREFSFDKEITAANDALRNAKDDVRALILETYVNVLPYAKEAEEGERIIEAIKDLGHRRHKLTSYQTHVMSNCKSRIARLSHDVREIQLSISKLCSEEQYKRFADVVIAFTKLASSHRIWHSKESYDELDSILEQVYFDLGIFNFIQAPLMTPMMRDSVGRNHFLYPNFWISSAGSVDFEVHPLESLTFLFREVPYEMISNLVLDSYSNLDESTTVRHRRNYEQFESGLLVNKDMVAIDDMEKENRMRERVVGELYVPELRLRYYVREKNTLKQFVETLNKYKNEK